MAPLRITLAATLSLVALSGCATVAPYEREYLSRPCMDAALDTKALAFRAHVHESREGASGGYGAAGGGCGCN